MSTDKKTSSVCPGGTAPGGIVRDTLENAKCLVLGIPLYHYAVTYPVPGTASLSPALVRLPHCAGVASLVLFVDGGPCCSSPLVALGHEDAVDSEYLWCAMCMK